MDLWVSSGDRSPWWTHSPHGRASGPAFRSSRKLDLHTELPSAQRSHLLLEYHVGRSDPQPPATANPCDDAARPFPPPSPSPWPVPLGAEQERWPGQAWYCRPQGLSGQGRLSEPGKPRRLAKTRQEEFSLGERPCTEPHGGCARAHPQGPSCPCAQGPTRERSALPQASPSRDPGSPPCPLGRGRARPPAVPPWPALALVYKDTEAPMPLSTWEGSAHSAHVGRHLAPREPVPLLALASQGGQRALDAEHLAGNARPGSHSPSSPTLPTLPAHKGRGQHAGQALSCPESPGGGADPAPRRTPSPPSLPECQGPRNHVSSSQGGWPPLVCGLPGGASMPGHLRRRRWTQSARGPRKGGGAARGWSQAPICDRVGTSGQLGRRQQPQCLQPGWWQEGGRCGAPPHPHRKQGAPGAASGGEWGDRRAALGGRAGWQEAWARPF